VRETSLCGLGQNAPNAVVSTLRFFRHEYQAHIHDRTCAAGVCEMDAYPIREWPDHLHRLSSNGAVADPVAA